MADTRNPSGRPDNQSQEPSTSRKNAAGQRPAGSSDAPASPGMAGDTDPLPPGVKPDDPVTHERDLPVHAGAVTSDTQPIVTNSPSSHQPDYAPPAGSEPQGRITIIAAAVALVVIVFLLLYIFL